MTNLSRFSNVHIASQHEARGHTTNAKNKFHLYIFVNQELCQKNYDALKFQHLEICFHMFMPLRSKKFRTSPYAPI